MISDTTVDVSSVDVATPLTALAPGAGILHGAGTRGQLFKIDPRGRVARVPFLRGGQFELMLGTANESCAASSSRAIAS